MHKSLIGCYIYIGQMRLNLKNMATTDWGRVWQLQKFEQWPVIGFIFLDSNENLLVPKTATAMHHTNIYNFKKLFIILFFLSFCQIYTYESVSRPAFIWIQRVMSNLLKCHKFIFISKLFIYWSKLLYIKFFTLPGFLPYFYRTKSFLESTQKKWTEISLYCFI